MENKQDIWRRLEFPDKGGRTCKHYAEENLAWGDPTTGPPCSKSANRRTTLA